MPCEFGASPEPANTASPEGLLHGAHVAPARISRRNQPGPKVRRSVAPPAAGICLSRRSSPGLGVGATRLCSESFNGVLLSPLPYRAPTSSWRSRRGGMRGQAPRSAVSPELSRHPLGDEGPADAGVLPQLGHAHGSGRAVCVSATGVTPSLLSTLGEAPLLGRGLRPTRAHRARTESRSSLHGLGSVTSAASGPRSGRRSGSTGSYTIGA